MRRFWTDAERAALRELYPASTAAEVALRLGRTPKAVYLEAKKLGLAVQPRITTGQAFLDAVRRLNAAGFPDQEIAAELGCERHTVAKHRKALGLPSNARGGRYRARVRERTARQCREAGVASLAEVRVLVFRKRAEAAGWPAGLAPREVQILDALAARGPMTRREIADAVGMPWLGSRASLRCKAGRGSYLANLAAYGLVVSLGRVVSGRGKGGSLHLYSLNLTAERAWRDGEAG